MSGASNADPAKVVLTARWIPDKGEGGRYFGSASYWVTSDWSLGVDYRPLIDEVQVNSIYRLVSEDPHTWWHPAVILGTSKEDFTFGDVEIESRAWFGTISKALPRIEPLNLSVSPYVGAVWLDEKSELRPLAVVNFGHSMASVLVQYSGTDTHLTLTKRVNDHLSVSGVYWGLKYPGVAMRWAF